MNAIWTQALQTKYGRHRALLMTPWLLWAAAGDGCRRDQVLAYADLPAFGGDQRIGRSHEQAGVRAQHSTAVSGGSSDQVWCMLGPAAVHASRLPGTAVPCECLLCPASKQLHLPALVTAFAIAACHACMKNTMSCTCVQVCAW